MTKSKNTTRRGTWILHDYWYYLKIKKSYGHMGGELFFQIGRLGHVDIVAWDKRINVGFARNNLGSTDGTKWDDRPA